jgi:hypothetical protein
MNITPDQTRVLRDAVRKRTAFLHAVHARMYRAGLTDDPLYAMFGEAEAALTRLAAALHDRTIIIGDRRPWESGSVSEPGSPAGGQPPTWNHRFMDGRT